MPPPLRIGPSAAATRGLALTPHFDSGNATLVCGAAPVLAHPASPAAIDRKRRRDAQIRRLSNSGPRKPPACAERARPPPDPHITPSHRPLFAGTSPASAPSDLPSSEGVAGASPEWQMRLEIR